MKTDRIMNLISKVGKGILIGIGIGTALFGVFFMASSFTQESPLNIAALVATLAGSFCILLALKS